MRPLCLVGHLPCRGVEGERGTGRRSGKRRSRRPGVACWVDVSGEPDAREERGMWHSAVCSRGATWSSSGLRLRSKNSACPLSGAILDIPCDMFPARQHLAAGKIRFWDPTLYYNYPLFTSKVDTPFGSTTDLVVLLTTASTHVTSDEVGVAPDLGAAEGACAAIVHLC